MPGKKPEKFQPGKFPIEIQSDNYFIDCSLSGEAGISNRRQLVILSQMFSANEQLVTVVPQGFCRCVETTMLNSFIGI